MGQPELSIVMPAHNEAEFLAASISTVVRGARAAGWDFELLLVENGSTDATMSIATRLAGSHPELQVVHLARADYGNAVRHGLQAARGSVIVKFDVDYFDLAFAKGARVLIADGAAVVIGTKRGAGATDRRGLARRAATATLVALLKIGFGLRSSDTHGLQAFDRRSVAGLVERCLSNADLFDTELILRAERAGLAIAELPADVVETRPARLSLSRRVPRTLAGLARLRGRLWWEALGWAGPNSSGSGSGSPLLADQPRAHH